MKTNWGKYNHGVNGVGFFKLKGEQEIKARRDNGKWFCRPGEGIMAEVGNIQACGAMNETVMGRTLALCPLLKRMQISLCSLCSHRSAWNSIINDSFDLIGDAGRGALKNRGKRGRNILLMHFSSPRTSQNPPY
jgi:hypothetical protein